MAGTPQQVLFKFQDDGRKELLFEAGDTLKLTTDDAFKEKCTKEVVWLDYKNITKVNMKHC